MVCTPHRHVPGGVNAYQLIDGQQRLTTLSILLTALKNQAAELDMPQLVEQIHEGFLIHKWQNGTDRYRVVPRMEHLGYDTDGTHPDHRRLVFVGDLTDRGPDIDGPRKTLVRSSGISVPSLWSALRERFSPIQLSGKLDRGRSKRLLCSLRIGSSMSDNEE